MQINSIVLTHAQSNCYMLEDENAALVVDPGAFDERVLDFLNKNADKQRLILLTHGHFDHIGGADELRRKTGVKIAVGALDAPALSDGRLSLSDAFRAHLKPFLADVELKDGEKITVGDLQITAYHTAGHTVGGMCYYLNGIVFTGDTLFEGTVGNTRFLGGDMNTLLKSVNHLVEILPPETLVYAGHGGITTIERERQSNPFVG